MVKVCDVSFIAIDTFVVQEASEGSMAKDAFGGRLTQDFVAERLNNSNFNDIREIDFPQCNIRSVDLGAGEAFLNLRR